jgi:SAM-dependent methyltransferase
VFAWVAFLGALLLFQVQLVLGKQLLPWFGGTSAVWTTCLLFFQAALLAGYLWAHVLVARFPARRQRAAHLSLLAAALALLAWRAGSWPSPIAPGDAGHPAAGPPVLGILLWLGSTIGLPFVALAATSPLLQAWFARARPGRSPFRLFAFSNAGSLAGLAGYPLLVEPLAPVVAQGWAWAVGFAVLAAGVASCAAEAAAAPEPPAAEAAPFGDERPRTLLWLALAFAPSVLLSAVTSHLTQEVAAVPLLWTLPLALYLLSFVLSFAWPDALRPAWRVALAAAALVSLVGLHSALRLGAGTRIVLWCAVLFVFATAGHGELARLRPSPRRLTGYYLAIAVGGALGAAFCALAAPVLFDGYWELHVGLLAGAAAVLAGAAAGSEPSPAAAQLKIASGLAVVCFGTALAADVLDRESGLERSSRGFYGVLCVVRDSRGDPDEHVRLLHGRINHGLQIVARPLEPTTYYGPASGVGAALRRHPKRRAAQPLRVGVVGLGVGTLAAYARPGDVFRFYELDPEVVRLSQGPSPVFTFLREAQGETSVVTGDGRLVLESEPPRGFDVLVLDAFSSDAVPAHLLTREAFATWLRHLAPGGVLAVHVTNRYIDLERVVRGAALAHGLEAERVPCLQDGLRWSADWMLLSRDRTLLDDEAVGSGALPWPYRGREVLWTDAWSNPVGVLKR